MCKFFISSLGSMCGAPFCPSGLCRALSLNKNGNRQEGAHWLDHKINSNESSKFSSLLTREMSELTM